MVKLSYKDKINIYNKRKNGESLSMLSHKYNVGTSRIKYIIRLVDIHGLDILKPKKNKYYPPHQKEQIINRVLINNEAVLSVAIDEGLGSKGILDNWIKNYKDMGYNIVERKKGRSTMPKISKKKVNETIEEENKRLKEENLYLKAELEYSKKLRAVVQARKNRQQKKK